MSLRIGETFAWYRILRLLGSGGMGEVYLVQHPRLPRQEALMVLRPDLSSDPSFRERFIREVDLETAISTYIDSYNARAKPFAWTKTADQLLGKIKPKSINNTEH